MSVNPLAPALAAMSAIFFYFFGLIIPNIVIMMLGGDPGLPYLGSIIFSAGPILLGLISLCGCLVFLQKTRTWNRYWYLGIPLCLAIAVAIVSLFLSTVLPIASVLPLLADPGYLNRVAPGVALFLLPPCSALFFWSQKTIRGNGTGLVIIALGISILSTILLYGLFFPEQYAPGEHVGMSVYEPLYWFYLMLGMPAMGAMYLALAYKNKSGDAGPGAAVLRDVREIP
jgi:hypothetical protein